MENRGLRLKKFKIENRKLNLSRERGKKFLCTKIFEILDIFMLKKNDKKTDLFYFSDYLIRLLIFKL